MFASFEGLGGEGDRTDPTSWSPTAKKATIAGGVILGGVLLFALFSRASVCPKLQRQYTDNWLEHGYGLAEWTRREAAQKGCKWALEKRPDLMRDQGW